jgi:prophage regulatory protein
MTTILRLPTVKERTGLSRSSIYAFVARGTFPAPVSLGARAVGWNSEAVDAWITGRIEQSQLAEQGRAAKQAEDVSPIVHEDAKMSDAPAIESRPIARLGGLGLSLRLGMNASRSQSREVRWEPSGEVEA